MLPSNPTYELHNLVQFLLSSLFVIKKVILRYETGLVGLPLVFFNIIF